MIAAEQPIIEYIFEKDGEEIHSQKFLTAEEGYTYKSSAILNEEESKPKITDYRVAGVDGEDLTQATFQGSRLFIIMVDIRKASVSHIKEINNLAQGLEGKVDLLVLTSSSGEETEVFRHEHQLGVSYAFADATVLKTIIRSNPGIALWKDGTVLGNWHHNDTPTAEEVLKLLGY